MLQTLRDDFIIIAIWTQTLSAGVCDTVRRQPKTSLPSIKSRNYWEESQ
jgi:hypothetical protein